MPRGESRAPKNETKRAKFIRLTENRMTKALLAISNVQKLAQPRSYEYNENDVKQILEGLTNGVVKVRNSFAAPTAKVKEGFKLGAEAK